MDRGYFVSMFIYLKLVKLVLEYIEIDLIFAWLDLNFEYF